MGPNTLSNYSPPYHSVCSLWSPQCDQLIFIQSKTCICTYCAKVRRNPLHKVHVFRIYAPFHEESPDRSTKAWNAAANSLILMGVIVAMTVLLIILYKYRCYKTIHAWLILSSLMLLSIFSCLFLE